MDQIDLKMRLLQTTATNKGLRNENQMLREEILAQRAKTENAYISAKRLFSEELACVLLPNWLYQEVLKALLPNASPAERMNVHRMLVEWRTRDRAPWSSFRLRAAVLLGAGCGSART
jgi:hypothetical protein